MLTSTLTRPTSISPTFNCSRKIWLIESIDIGPFQSPKPRIVSLEPIHRRQRRTSNKKAKSVAADNKKPAASSEGSQCSEPTVTETVVDVLDSTEIETPQSPVPSEISRDSEISSST